MKSGQRNAIIVLSAIAALSLTFAIVIFLLLYPGWAKRSPLPITPTSVQVEMLENTLPADTSPTLDTGSSPLDGTYTKVDPSWPQWWLCRRCADYRLAGGIWKLVFDKGMMHIYYDMTGWRSMASFNISGDRLHIFNDPYCPDDEGEYTWEQGGGQIKLEVIDDTCSFQLRGKNLSNQPWLTCLPPEKTTHPASDWQAPPGCEGSPTMPEPAPASNLPINVTVHGGDSRFFKKPPDVFANANNADIPSPEGIYVTYHDQSIPYGLSRVLWWEGDWIQASTELPFASMGVQILGDPPIGWARVLFDGVEVWRGKTSAIWSYHGRHGGYVEISGFSPGTHVIRAESMAFDYRPVTVASFGFSYHEGVKSQEP